MIAHFEEGETWRKVFGPFFVYLNATTDVSKAYNLWLDAKKQVHCTLVALIHSFQPMM